MKTHFKIDLIKSEMTKRKLTKSKFACKCGISRYALDKILSDNTNINYSPVIKIAKYLGLKVEDLIYCV